MKRVVVGITGGIGSGKAALTNELALKLRNRAVEVSTVVHRTPQFGRTVLPNTECVLVHGLTLFEDHSLLSHLDVKIFLDEDPDMRLAKNLRNQRFYPSDFSAQRMFHINHVLKQKKLADIWIDEVTPDKIDWLTDIIMKAREDQEEKEPIEVAVYLDK